MITNLPYRHRRVAVLGLARSGRIAAAALLAAGAEVLAWDDGEKARESAGLALTDLRADDATTWAALVISPGIPLTHPTPHPVAVKAQAAGVPVLGDIELLWQANTGAGFIGITGTNGKSTTTSLIGHILTLAGGPTAIGGNLGTPVLSLPALPPQGHYVIEMSSYQLDLIHQTRFNIGLLLNVTPDHLDRHGDMKGYVAAKQRLFQTQQAGDSAIISQDDDWCQAVARALAAGPQRVIPIAVENRASAKGGVWVTADGRLIDDLDGQARPVIDLSTIPNLPGAHNWQNAAFAYAACREAGLAPETIAAALISFPGLAHRQELIGRMGGLRFINDSKATNADAAAKALGCYDGIYWIAGGVAKAGGIESLRPYFPRLRHAFLIGEAAAGFAETLAGAAPVTLSGDLASALSAAIQAAGSDDEAVILLSPAAASFDQFANFEARGEAFRSLVHATLSEPK